MNIDVLYNAEHKKRKDNHNYPFTTRMNPFILVSVCSRSLISHHRNMQLLHSVSAFFIFNLVSQTVVVSSWLQREHKRRDKTSWLPAATEKAKKITIDINLPRQSMREQSCSSCWNITVSFTTKREAETGSGRGGTGGMFGHMSKDVYVNSEWPDSRGLPLTVLLMKWKGADALLMISYLLKVISL